jgi:hypothetical protein
MSAWPGNRISAAVRLGSMAGQMPPVTIQQDSSLETMMPETRSDYIYMCHACHSINHLPSGVTSGRNMFTAEETRENVLQSKAACNEGSI